MISCTADSFQPPLLVKLALYIMEVNPDKAAFVAAVNEFFSLVDTDESGSISKAEMLAYVRIDGDGDGVSAARGFIADADANEDGKVSLYACSRKRLFRK